MLLYHLVWGIQEERDISWDCYFCLKVNIHWGKLPLTQSFCIQINFYLCTWFKSANWFWAEWPPHHFACKMKLCAMADFYSHIFARAQVWNGVWNGIWNGTVTSKFKLATNSDLQKFYERSFLLNVLVSPWTSYLFFKESAAFCFVSVTLWKHWHEVLH